MIDQIVTSILFDLAEALHKEQTLRGFEDFLKLDGDAILQAMGSLSKRLVHNAVVHDESKETALLEKSVLGFLTTDVRDALYSQDSSTLPRRTKSTIDELRKLYNEGQIAYACAELAYALGKTQLALIQSPILLSGEEKRTMINELTKSAPLFPLFVVRRELVGGVRVLIDDMLFDDTFHTQLQRLFAAVS